MRYKILCFLLALFLIGCNGSDHTRNIYQLSNQSYSQMMSYVIEYDDLLIVVDGGTSEDKENLINTIKEVSDDDTVDIWLITHYHKDHTGALMSYLNDNNNEITIENIYYYFPEDEDVKVNEENRYQDYLNISDVLSKQDNTIIVNEDTVIEASNDVTIDVVRVYNPQITNNFGNNSSNVYKINTSECTILFLGDLGVEGGQELLENYSDEIKDMDYVQMSHHGQAGVEENVYQVINPDYCLWPTTDWLWANEGNAYKTDETKEWIEKLDVKENYVADKGTTEIPIN